MTFSQITAGRNAIEEHLPALKPLLQLLETGGPVVWLLALLSVIAITVALGKLWQQWRMRDQSSRVEEALDLLERGQTDQAATVSAAQAGPRGRILAQAIRLLTEQVMTTDEVRAELARVSRVAIAPQATGLRTLEVIAAVAPLLGLLGTVLGMIEAFRAMEAAGTQINPAILSGGIWQALLTTAVGLAVAIPVSLLHSWFERRFELKLMGIQNDVQRTIKAFFVLRAKPATILAAA